MRVRWFVGVPWWIALWLWLIWFTVTILLTFAGLCVLAGAGVIWLVGAIISLRWPHAGRGWQAVARGVFNATAAAVDTMNGHRRQS